MQFDIGRIVMDGGIRRGRDTAEDPRAEEQAAIEANVAQVGKGNDVVDSDRRKYIDEDVLCAAISVVECEPELLKMRGMFDTPKEVAEP